MSSPSSCSAHSSQRQASDGSAHPAHDGIGAATDATRPEGGAGPYPVRFAQGKTLLLGLGLVSVVVSLALRIIHRGPYCPGWDVVGAAQGLMLVATKSPLDLLRWYGDKHYDPTTAWNTYGAPVVLLPGLLSAIFPWEYWAHVVTLVGTLLSLVLVGRAFKLRGSEWAIIVLAWGASASMLSYSICGFPYFSAAWPYALALWLILRCQERPLVTFLLSALIIELSRHVQELGRTVFVVFLAAAFLIRPARPLTRAAWFLAGAGLLADSLWHHSFNTARYSHLD